MDQKAIGDTPFGFIGAGETVVLEQRFEDGAVWINETQRFEDVPKVAWETYVGGYPPAQKWLVDRKRHQLDFDDILHYQRIIKVLSETNRIMSMMETQKL